MPEMKRILEEYNKVWEDTKQKFGANYIYSEGNFLFLEYLQSQDYQRISDLSLPIHVAKATLRKLAQFHASSLVYLKKCPADDVIPKVPLLLANDEIERRLYAAIKIIEGYWPEFKDITTKLRSYVETINKSITGLMANKLSQYKIIALGEPSIKNMLVETIQRVTSNVRILDANVVFHPANGIVFQTPPLLAKDDVEKRMHAAIKAVEEIFPQFEEICTKMRKNVDSFHQRITDLLEKRRCQFKVIALGDLSMQNIIFDGKCGRYSLFKNFESCFIGSCGYDLNFFFNACVSLKVLALHRYDLLRVYHQHLTQILNFFDDCFVPSLQTILDEVRDLELFGFYVLLCKMPFCDEESDFRKGYVMEKSVVKTFAFEEDYERVLHEEDIQEILKYGLDRFNDLRLWDDNTNDNVIKKEKQEDAYGFVMLERLTI
ncbi:uncharacterized protein LOC118745076 [Rhagoletis pomonella]|uniref:uncharacterized protein LOC118745076 n=1 Tax=Rhagoletis pomonella TaxID=28610 RepID=UPI00177B870B|nr:uncharacterized protein LOC118745076 [Rhagoletis pomonella]